MKKIILLLKIIIFLLVIFLIFFYFKQLNTDEKNKKVSVGKNIVVKENVKKNEKKDHKISQIIISHHLFAKTEINSFLKDFSDKNPDFDRIILISPNHFNSGNNEIIIRNSDFKIGKDTFMVNSKTVDHILESGVVHVKNNAFTFEHGIFNLIPIIHNYYNDISVTPLILRLDTNNEKLKKLSENILNFSGSTLVIYSIDFSHALDKNFSYLHDLKTQDDLFELSNKNLNNLDIDCPECLEVGFYIAKNNKNNSFEVYKRTSAADIANKDFPGENTSYILGKFTNKRIFQKENRKAYMLFGGDVMLDRQIRIYSKVSGVKNYFNDIDRLFWSWDVVVFNLEGVIGKRKSLSVGMPMNNPNHFKFTFSEKDFLDLSHSIRSPLIINDGNNHSLNFGYVGVKESRKFLKNNKFEFFGDIKNEDYNILRKNINGRDMSFVSYNAFLGKNLNKTIEDIAREKKYNRDVIVYAHWGYEYKKNISSKVQEIAYKFVDAGAKMVIGSHPHVSQPIEIYNDSIIFYSLGNLIFDQFFDSDVSQRVLIGCMLSDKKIICAISPFEHNRIKGLIFQRDNDRKQFFDWLSVNSKVSIIQKENLNNGIIEVDF